MGGYLTLIYVYVPKMGQWKQSHTQYATSLSQLMAIFRQVDVISMTKWRKWAHTHATPFLEDYDSFQEQMWAENKSYFCCVFVFVIFVILVPSTNWISDLRVLVQFIAKFTSAWPNREVGACTHSDRLGVRIVSNNKESRKRRRFDFSQPFLFISSPKSDIGLVLGQKLSDLSISAELRDWAPIRTNFDDKRWIFDVFLSWLLQGMIFRKLYLYHWGKDH